MNLSAASPYPTPFIAVYLGILLLLPVFFVITGFNVDLGAIDAAGLVELLLILLAAIAGKFIGAFAAARFQRVPRRQATALATLMNTRGLTELVILNIGVQLGVLDGEMFTLLVIMSVVTTVMPVANWLRARRNSAPSIMLPGFYADLFGAEAERPTATNCS